MKALKGNKEYLIDEKQQKFYQDSGFDILDDSGAVIAHGRGKKIPYEEYEELLKESAILKEKLEGHQDKPERQQNKPAAKKKETEEEGK